MGVFGIRLKACRMAQGMSQAALARALGMPRQQINNYEGGRFEPTLEIARKIADVLQVSLDTLTTPAESATPEEAPRSGQESGPRPTPSYTASVDLGKVLVDNLDDIAAVLEQAEGATYR